jgi:ABC-2 type transport system ATP-binding protein
MRPTRLARRRSAPPPRGVPPPRSATPARTPTAAGRTPGAGRPGPPVITVHNLRKTYADGTPAVRGVSFHVAKGEIFGLLGPNGAGKTTIMRILGTLHPASAGTATVLGLDVGRQAARVRERIGFAMQEVGMDDLATAREMVVFHARLAGIAKADAVRRAAALLETFGLTDHADRRVTRFSGGMQRRLDLAVSLVHQPEVLFLDEPSTGLDPASRADLWKVLRGLREEHGITVVMSTHYMEEADVLCDRIAIIADGRIAAIDTPANLKRSVGQDRIRVELGRAATDVQRTKVQRALGDGAHFDDGVLVVSVPDGGRALMPTLRAASDAGLDVVATRVLSPTLDDVFLRYTGKRLAEAEAADAGHSRRGEDA